MEMDFCSVKLKLKDRVVLRHQNYMKASFSTTSCSSSSSTSSTSSSSETSSAYVSIRKKKIAKINEEQNCKDSNPALSDKKTQSEEQRPLSETEDGRAMYNAEDERIRLQLEQRQGMAFQSWKLKAVISTKNSAEKLRTQIQENASSVCYTESVRALVRMVPQLVYELRTFPDIPEETEMETRDAEDCVYLVLLLAAQAQEFWQPQGKLTTEEDLVAKVQLRYQVTVLSGTARLRPVLRNAPANR